MVSNPTDLTEIDLYRDPDSGRLVGRDPVSGDTFALPLDGVESPSGTIGDLDTQRLNCGRLSQHPSSVPSGHVAVYVLDSDGGVYRKPSGGDPAQVGGSSGGEWTVDADGDLVPADGEVIGDGTTTASHGSVSAADQLAVPVYTSDSDAPVASHYFNSNDGLLKYKAADGTVHAGDGGLQAGEDFDGQGTADLQNLNSVETGELSATNETYVQARSTTDSSSTAADTYVTVPFDVEVYDHRGEFSPSPHQFTPDRSGVYDITAIVVINVDTSGDRIDVRFQNVTDGATLLTQRYFTSNTGFIPIPAFAFTDKLDAGDTYEVQATNVDSSFNTVGDGSRSKLFIRPRYQP